MIFKADKNGKVTSYKDLWAERSWVEPIEAITDFATKKYKTYELVGTL